MSEDLDFGYQKPTAGDESAQEFMPIIEDFIDRIIHHSHDGNDSPLLSDVDLIKTTVDVLAGKVVTTATYNSGSPNAVLGVTGITENMYGYNSDIGYEAYVISVSGTDVVMSSDFTASEIGKSITFSNYKKLSESMFERDITLFPSDIAINNNYKFYITTTGDYYLRNINPSIKDTISNMVTIQLNDDSLDLKLVLS